MTPAAQLQHALQIARSALDQIPTSAGLEVAGRIDDLKSAVDELPDRVLDLEETRCADCALYSATTMRHPYGDGTAMQVFYECAAKQATDCPAVRALGFGVEDLPNYLRRQAE